jgi:flagellar assembly protein FliH
LYKIIKSISLRDTPVIIATGPPTVHCTVNLENDIACTSKIRQTQSECDTLIAEAATKAEQIIGQATEESQKLQANATNVGHQEGYDAGFSLGLEAGKEQAQQAMAEELSRSAQQATKLLKMAQQDGQTMILAAEQQIVELAMTVARKILLREINENPLVVLPIVRGALEKVRDQQVVTVRVHSLDYDLIMQSRHDLQALIGREQPILVQSDDSVHQGSCLIDSTSGTVDARIDTQLESIQKALQEVVL